MPKSYSLADARSHLAEIVDEAEAGGEVELTRRGPKEIVYAMPSPCASCA